MPNLVDICVAVAICAIAWVVAVKTGKDLK